MGGRLFEKHFVDNVIQRLDEQHNELQSLREFKRKITTNIRQIGPFVSAVCAFCEKNVSGTEFDYHDHFLQCDCCKKITCYNCWTTCIGYKRIFDPQECDSCLHCNNVRYDKCKYSGKHIDCEDVFGNCDECDKKLCEFCTIRVYSKE